MLKNALDNIHKDFAVVRIDKATGNIGNIGNIVKDFMPLLLLENWN